MDQNIQEQVSQQVDFLGLFLTGFHSATELLNAATPAQLTLLVTLVSQVVYNQETDSDCPTVKALLQCPHPSSAWLDPARAELLKHHSSDARQALQSIAPALHHVVALFV